MKYPIYQPYLTGNEKYYVNDCLDAEWISSQGKYVSLFEEAVAGYIGVKHAVSVFNGTVALHLALIAADIGPGDEVLVPDFTYIASANSILYVGAKPVLVDVDPDDWNISLELIQKKITNRTKAIMTTDIYGLPANYNEIEVVAKKNGLLIIEDSAESFGADYVGRKAGSLGDIATFSFFGNKTITTGEGGMLLTNNPDYASIARKVRNQGNSENIRYYHDVLGHNFRMTNIQAAIGLAQVEQVERILSEKQRIFTVYSKRLSAYFKFQKQAESVTSSYWMVGFLCETEKERSELAIFLNKKEIDTRPFFRPIHKMPFYPNEDSPVALDLSEKGLSLPSYPALTDQDIHYICDEIESFITNFRKNKNIIKDN